MPDDPRVASLAQAMYLQQPHTCDDRMFNCAAAILDALDAADWALVPVGTAAADVQRDYYRLRRIEEAARALPPAWDAAGWDLWSAEQDVFIEALDALRAALEEGK